MVRKIAFAATAFALVTPAAFADTGKAIDACQVALTEEAAERFNGAEFEFRSVKGGSTKKIRFTAEYAGEEDSVMCKAKRGKVVSIDWPESFVQLADAKPAKTAKK